MKFIAIAISLLSIPAFSCDIPSCQKTWDANGGWSTWSKAKNGISSDTEYSSAQKALNFEIECSCFVKTDQMMQVSFNEMRPVIEKNLTAWKADEPNRKTQEVERKAVCPVFDACSKEEEDKKFLSYISFAEAGGQTSGEIFEFYKRCNCYAVQSKIAKKYANLVKLEEIVQRDRAEKIIQAKKQKEENEKAEKIRLAEVDNEAKVQRIADQEHSRRQKSPECQRTKLLYFYCKNLQIVSVQNQNIEHEKKISKASGYENAQVLRFAAAAKIRAQEENLQITGQYKQLGGDIKSQKCDAEKINSDISKICGGFD